MKKILLTCLTIIALASCSSDDSSAAVVPGTPGPQQQQTQNVNVAGKWMEVEQEDEETGEWRIMDECTAMVYEFKNDSKFVLYNSCTPESTMEHIYAVNGSVVTLTLANSTNINYKITPINANSFYMQSFMTVAGITGYGIKYRMEKQE